jgi:uncharacterized protein (DUF2336 family)
MAFLLALVFLDFEVPEAAVVAWTLLPDHRAAGAGERERLSLEVDLSTFLHGFFDSVVVALALWSDCHPAGVDGERLSLGADLSASVAESLRVIGIAGRQEIANSVRSCRERNGPKDSGC